MVAMANPALERFVAQIQNELVLAQVLVVRKERGYELRHLADRAASPSDLRLLPPAELRALAQFTADGAFRPLKSAPNLQPGWRAVAAHEGELEGALRDLYPGAIADWFAAQAAAPPVTNFRDFTNRQTGMYRVTTLLNDDQAAEVIRAGCHRQFCLKRRLWSVEGLAIDAPTQKSIIPCLEPCAVLLEFSRTAVRMAQGKEQNLRLSSADALTIQAALESALDQTASGEREADFSSPRNRRRIQLLLEKLKPLLDAAAEENTGQTPK